MIKKRFFPGTNTIFERKRFVIFHTFTLIIAPIIGACFLLLINLIELITVNNPISITILLKPLNNINKWLMYSLFSWNFIGSIRKFNDDIENVGFILAATNRSVYLLFFPLIYLFNLWLILIKKDNLKSQNNIVEKDSIH